MRRFPVSLKLSLQAFFRKHLKRKGTRFRLINRLKSPLWSLRSFRFTNFILPFKASAEMILSIITIPHRLFPDHSILHCYFTTGSQYTAIEYSRSSIFKIFPLTEYYLSINPHGNPHRIANNPLTAKSKSSKRSKR